MQAIVTKCQKWRKHANDGDNVRQKYVQVKQEMTYSLLHDFAANNGISSVFCWFRLGLFGTNLIAKEKKKEKRMMVLFRYPGFLKRETSAGRAERTGLENPERHGRPPFGRTLMKRHRTDVQAPDSVGQRRPEMAG